MRSKLKDWQQVTITLETENDGYQFHSLLAFTQLVDMMIKYLGTKSCDTYYQKLGYNGYTSKENKIYNLRSVPKLTEDNLSGIKPVTIK